MKYAWINTHHYEFRVGQMRKILHVSRSAYYDWLTLPFSLRKLENKILTEKIKIIFTVNRGSYGTRRIKRALAKDDLIVSCELALQVGYSVSTLIGPLH